MSVTESATANKVFSYLLWRLILTRPRAHRLLRRLLFPNRERFITFGVASIFIHCQEESGLYRADRAMVGVPALRDEIPMLLVLASLLEPNSTFVDCGANVGIWSANVAAMGAVLPGVKILAFEPHPVTFARLLKTMQRYSNVECHNVALSNCRRQLELAEGAGSQTFGVPKSHFQIKGHTRMVQARPLDELLVGRCGIMIKVDVEGHEYEVLSGARATLASGRVRAVLLDGCDPPYREKIIADLRGFGFELRNLRTLEPLARGQDRILALRGSSQARFLERPLAADDKSTENGGGSRRRP